MQRVFITGCSGYLAQRLIEACRNDPDIEWIGGIDIRPPQQFEGFHYFEMDVRSPNLSSLLHEHAITVLVHLAWVFNPTHDEALERQIDVEGSKNVLDSARTARIPYFIYLSSTTAYGPHPDNPMIFDEEYPRRGHAAYLYSKFKAEVDHIFLDFIKSNPQIRIFVIRAPIILGPNTRNVVTQVTDLPVLVGIRNFDPPMQFLHENDLRRLLLWALKNQPEGVFNIPGTGTIRFSEIAKHLKKSLLWLPDWIVYPLVGLLWRLRLVSFPSSLLDFIRYPWVASGERFSRAYEFRVHHTSEEAFLSYAMARWPEKF